MESRSWWWGVVVGLVACGREPRPAESPGNPPAPVVVATVSPVASAPARSDDGPQALARHEQACASNDVVSCLAAATMLDEGTSVPADEARARAYVDRACKMQTVAVNSIACGRLAEMDQRVQPREKIVYRSFYIDHHDAGSHLSPRTQDEAKKLATEAVAALERGESFDAVSDRVGGADPVLRRSRAEVVTFRLKPTAEHRTPVQSLQPGHASFSPHPTFGFVVWYRVS